MNENYKISYLKYKKKYLNLKKKLHGGTLTLEEKKLINKFETEGNGQGIIIGHGSQLDNFCLIPDNIILRPMSKSGSATLIDDLQDFDMDSLKKRPDRKLISEFTVDGIDYNNWYLPGSLIPNININLRTVFRGEREFSFTGVITGTIYESNPSTGIIIFPYVNEDQTRQKSLQYHDSRLLPGDIWNTHILLSELLQIMSRNINIYTSPTEKIPKIYILAACRVGDESISFNTLQKCLTDLKEEQRRESGFEELSSFTRTKSASQIEIFKTFKKIYDDVSSLITSGNLDNINRFIPADIAKTPETQKSIHQILQSALGDISYHIQNGLVTPKYFCMLKNLLEHNFSYEYKKLYLDLLIKLRKP
jgi:hypothetical protein